ncbi:MAG: alpha/beta hydrolase [Chthoniobacterales bacterium]
MSRRHVITLPLLLVGGYALICAALYFAQDSLVYFPRNAPAAELDGAAASVGFAPWTNGDGHRIGWQSLDGDPRHALLIFHGNGGYALHRNHFASTNHPADGTAQPRTYLLEYPGYGARPGTPSEASLTAAATDAIDTLAATDPAPRITVLGQSLGSGVASAAVGQRPDAVSALILVTPFNSLVAAAHDHYRWIPVPWLLRTRFDSVRNLADYPGPVAFIVAKEDQTVPAHLGQALYESYPGTKRLWLIPDAHHNDTDRLLADWPEVWTWLATSR